jgi:hypothetical protein
MFFAVSFIAAWSVYAWVIFTNLHKNATFFESDKNLHHKGEEALCYTLYVLSRASAGS